MPEDLTGLSILHDEEPLSCLPFNKQPVYVGGERADMKHCKAEGCLRSAWLVPRRSQASPPPLGASILLAAVRDNVIVGLQQTAQRTREPSRNWVPK